jgi:hypothetical protein
MALVLATLEAEFKKLMDPDDPGFLGHPPTIANAAAAWKDAYDLYASQAVDVSNDPLTTANPAGFEAMLATLLPPGDPGGNPSQAADAFEQAFSTYWTGGIFATGFPPTPAPVCPNVGGNGIWSIEQSSIVLSVTPNILKALLEIEFAILQEDGSAKATALANAFHTATTSAVMVLITGLDTSVPTPLPITNTCTIF